jgi:hypothetical protein
MPSVGPDLPPHLLAKRKREDEEEAARASKSPRSQPSTTPEASEKRRRIIGPAPPPAPLDELPNTTAHEKDDSSSDDEFGPAVPTGDAVKVRLIALLSPVMMLTDFRQAIIPSMILLSPRMKMQKLQLKLVCKGKPGC